MADHKRNAEPGESPMTKRRTRSKSAVDKISTTQSTGAIPKQFTQLGTVQHSPIASKQPSQQNVVNESAQTVSTDPSVITNVTTQSPPDSYKTTSATQPTTSSIENQSDVVTKPSDTIDRLSSTASKQATGIVGQNVDDNSNNASIDDTSQPSKVAATANTMNDASLVPSTAVSQQPIQLPTSTPTMTNTVTRNFMGTGMQQPYSCVVKTGTTATQQPNFYDESSKTIRVAQQGENNNVISGNSQDKAGTRPTRSSEMSVLGLYRTTAMRANDITVTVDQSQHQSAVQRMEQLTIDDTDEEMNEDPAKEAYQSFRKQCSTQLLGMERIGERVTDPTLVFEAAKTQEELLGKYHQRIVSRAEALETSEVLTPEYESEVTQFLLDVDELYTEIKTKVLVRQRELAAPERAATNAVRETNPLDQLALKRLSFERFAGDELKWPNFRAKFEQFFHNNTSLDAMTKFLRLDDCIEINSEAYKSIFGIERVPENYLPTWQKLVDKYENPRRQIDAILNKFIDTPAIASATRDNIVSLSNAITSTTTSLARYESLNIASWDAIFVNLALRKLDRESLSLWQHERPQKEIPKLQPLLDFLNKRADGRQNTFAVGTSNQNHSNNPPTGGAESLALQQANTNQQSQSNASQAGGRLRSHIKVPVKCSLCGSEHQLFNCSTFRKLPIEERARRVRQYRVCEKCLKPKCSIERCKLGPCKHCQGNHNGLLCTVTTVGDGDTSTMTSVN